MRVTDIFSIFEKSGLTIDIAALLSSKDAKVSNEKHYTHENNLYLILEWRNTMRICHEYLPMIEPSIYSTESQDNAGMKPASDITNNGRG